MKRIMDKLKALGFELVIRDDDGSWIFRRDDSWVILDTKNKVVRIASVVLTYDGAGGSLLEQHL